MVLGVGCWVCVKKKTKTIISPAAMIVVECHSPGLEGSTMARDIQHKAFGIQHRGRVLLLPALHTHFPFPTRWDPAQPNFPLSPPSPSRFHLNNADADAGVPSASDSHFAFPSTSISTIKKFETPVPHATPYTTVMHHYHSYAMYHNPSTSTCTPTSPSLR